VKVPTDSCKYLGVGTVAENSDDVYTETRTEKFAFPSKFSFLYLIVVFLFAITVLLYCV
jgi:hypothetical protein